MPHASVSVVTLRPLDELGQEPARQARGGGAHARDAARGPAVGGRGVLEMLDLGIAILREHFALMVGLGALAWLPVRLLQPFIGAHVWEDSIGSGAMIGPVLSGLVNTGSAALAQCFAAALLARVVHAALEGREVAGARAQALAWSGLSGTSYDIVFVLVSSLLLGVAIALHSALLTVYYADCRVRREGADLEAQRAQLGAAGRPA